MDNNTRLLLAEIDWLAENSEGVAGLAADGSITPWPKVIELYMPLVNHRDKAWPADG